MNKTIRIYLPFLGEFGWYIFCFVKKIHGETGVRKIVCCKKGHECLFPTATYFFYDWNDISDNIKAGIHPNFLHETELKDRILKHFNLKEEDVEWSSSSSSGWHDKHQYADNVFIPQPVHPQGLQADVVITPRFRKVDEHRNWKKENWQLVVDELSSMNISVAVCGSKDSSYHLQNVKFNSWDYIDIDSDIELMKNAKLVITQESGLQYLSFLCQKPTMCIDHYHKQHGADLHRPKHIPFKEIYYVWNDPKLLVKEIQSFLINA